MYPTISTLAQSLRSLTGSFVSLTSPVTYIIVRLRLACFVNTNVKDLTYHAFFPPHKKSFVTIFQKNFRSNVKGQRVRRSKGQNVSRSKGQSVKGQKVKGEKVKGQEAKGQSQVKGQSSGQVE